MLFPWAWRAYATPGRGRRNKKCSVEGGRADVTRHAAAESARFEEKEVGDSYRFSVVCRAG